MNAEKNAPRLLGAAFLFVAFDGFRCVVGATPPQTQNSRI
jgi:hypothetical protein